MGIFCDHEWQSDGHTGGGTFTKKRYQHKCKKCGKKQDCDKNGPEVTSYSDNIWATTCSKCSQGTS